MLQDALQLRQLYPVVYTQNFILIHRSCAFNFNTFTSSHGNDICQIKLTLRIVVIEPFQPVPQTTRRRSKKAAVYFPYCQLGITRVFLFDDTHQPTLIITQHPAIALRVIKLRCQNCELTGPGFFNQLRKCACLYQGHIAV